MSSEIWPDETFLQPAVWYLSLSLSLLRFLNESRIKEMSAGFIMIKTLYNYESEYTTYVQLLKLLQLVPTTNNPPNPDHTYPSM